MRVLFLVFFCLLMSGSLWSQKIDHLVSFRNIEKEYYFRFNYDNDYFAATDENYTQGYSFEFVHPKLEKNPVNLLFFKPKVTRMKYGISIEHIGFTPNNYVSDEIQFGDRPFAAAIMLKSFTVGVNSELKTRWSQSVSLGIIGPGAFGEEMQVEIHRLTGNKIPLGWKHQIRNDVVLNYRVDFEKQLFYYKDYFALQAGSTANLGTLFTNASISLNSQIGLISNPFSAEKRKNFKLYFYSQPVLSIIGYDASLQGGLINRSSVYTIDSQNVERFTAQFNYGLILKTRTLYFEYARTAITREFDSGKDAKWGGIKIGFTF